MALNFTTPGSASFRKQIADGLKKSLGRGWAVFPDAKPVNAITRPTVLMERTSFTKPNMGSYQSTYTVLVIGNQTVAETKEDVLDGLVDTAAQALEDLGLIWQSAERAVYNGTNPCYKFTILASNTRKK